MTTYFTSDLHIAHANILKYSSRPFATIDEMDAALLDNWNNVIRKHDTVYLLGDLTLAGPDVATRFLAQANGTKHLIWGNHDRNAVRELPHWSSSVPMAEINLDGHRITLCHYAMRVWNRSHHGSLMFYGHSHGTLPGTNQSCDVGVDAWNFRPVTLPEILSRLATLPRHYSGDHHVNEQF